MNFDLYKKLIDEIATFKKLPTLGLNISGESLLHPRFPEMLEYAASKGGFKVILATNGTLLDEPMSDLLCKLKVYHVVISLDGLEEVHEASRKGSKYIAVMNHIKSFVARRGAERLPRIAVNMTQYKQTVEQRRKFVNFWVQYVDEVEIYPAIDEDLNFMNEEFFDESINEERTYCSWPFSYLGVLWDGDAIACCPDCRGINVMGNLATQTISKIWKSTKYKTFRRQILKNSFLPDLFCGKCNYWKYGFTPRTVIQEGLKITYTGIGKIYERLV